MEEQKSGQSVTVLLKPTAIPFRCANCSIQVCADEFNVTELVTFDKDTCYWTPVTIWEIISKVYNVIDCSLDLDEDDFQLCSHCGNYLGELYKLYQGFYELRSIESRISSLLAKANCKNEGDNEGMNNKISKGPSPRIKISRVVLEKIKENKPNPEFQSTPANRKIKKLNPSSIPPVTTGMNLRTRSATVMPQYKQPKKPRLNSVHKANVPKIYKTVKKQVQKTKTVKVKVEPEDISDDLKFIVESAIAASSDPESTLDFADETFDDIDLNDNDDHLSPSSEFEDIKPTSTKEIVKTTNLAKSTVKRKRIRIRKANPNYIHPIPNPCTICGKVVSSRSYLKKHMDAVHHKLKPFQCSKCGKSFAVNNALKLHLETHEPDYDLNKKKFLCNICGKAFRTKGNLKCHLDVHLGVPRKSFKCELCFKSFDSKTHLAYHKSVHAGIKPFTCEICGKSFAKPNTLRIHSASHLPEHEKPHQCPYSDCGRRFPLKSGLKDHLLSSAHNLTLEEARAKAGISLANLIERIN